MATWDEMLQFFGQGSGAQPTPEEAERLRREATVGGRMEGLQAPFGGAFGSPMQGMEAIPFGPSGGRMLPRRAVQGGPRVLRGTVQGGPMVPAPNRPGIGRGQTYEGQTVPPAAGPGQGVDFIPKPYSPFAAGRSHPGAGGPAPQGRLRDEGIIYGQAPGPGVGASGGGAPGGPPPTSPAGRAFDVSPGARGPQQGFGDFLKGMWNNASLGQKAGGLGALGGAGATLWDMLTGGEEPDATETALLGQPRPEGTGGGIAMRNELPAAFSSEILEGIPEIDYANLPRPDFARVREQLAGLAPEAPEEMNFLDKVPSQMKNILGMGILLGPIGLLLGAGLGMAENKRKEKAAQEKFKEESRAHMREMLGFDLDWAKAERSMALEEQEGARSQAIEGITLQRQLQDWANQDAQTLQNLQLGDLRIGAAQREAAGGGRPKSVDDAFERALLTNPQAVFQMDQQIRSSENFPTPEDQTLMSKGQQKMLEQMIKANIASAFMQ